MPNSDEQYKLWEESYFEVERTIDSLGNTVYNDLSALKNLVNAILNSFGSICHDGVLVERLEKRLPVKPFNDVFEKMTDIQMGNFKEKLESLLNVLEDVEQEVDTYEGCKQLNKVFGDEFKIPEKSQTASKKDFFVSGKNVSA